jgi:dipeptidyl aminopeptidase/acylaminoacyl peptidase
MSPCWCVPWTTRDRWLASVDLAGAKLVTRDRLTDNAWINWGFNEFGWVPSSSGGDGALWFLSERSGYSHLYLNENGKTRALTSGKWEVSAPALAADGKTFYFVCNQKWPGDYEVCAVDRTGGPVREVTALDGVEDFSLSPDGRQAFGAPFRQLHAAPARGDERQRRRRRAAHRHAQA